tara:strand:- start:123 stop:677 length:555 start_codon:yes stop_codon:yes gene_type:complete
LSENNTKVTSNNSYAQALFELASENYVLLEIEKQAVAILKLIENSLEFSDLIKNPTIKNSELIKVMDTIADQNNFNGLLKRFINFLIQKRRFFYIEKILNDYLDVCSKSRGEIKAEIQTAKELNEIEISKVKEELVENFGSNMKLNYKHDPSLIGGLVLKVGSTMVDTSIKNKLHQIQKQMIEA